MTTPETNLIWGPLENFRTLLAGLETFQAFVGVAEHAHAGRQHGVLLSDALSKPMTTLGDLV
jgi:hypothetical protein